MIFAQSFQSLFSPTDLTIGRDGRFLYALNADQNGQGSPGINVFRVRERDGSLVALPGVTGLPTSVDGLVAR